MRKIHLVLDDGGIIDGLFMERSMNSSSDDTAYFLHEDGQIFRISKDRIADIVPDE